MTSTRTAPRSSVLILLFVALSATIAAIVWKNRAASHAAEVAAQQAAAHDARSKAAREPRRSSGAEELLAMRRRQSEPRTFIPAAIPEPAEPVAPVAPIEPLPLPASALASKALINELRQLQLEGGRLTPEQAEAWKSNFEKLKEQGADSVPAILEFLKENKDVRFTDVPGGRDLEFSSARVAMLDVLRGIAGPEATAALTDTLRTTADPRELAILARDLEAREPGVHRQEILEASRQTLEMAGKGGLGKQQDVGPLFEILQSFGDGSSVALLDQAHAKWNYYTDMALAELPEGAGIPRLIELAQKPATPGGRQRDEFALLLLGQLAPNSPEAKEALVQQFQEGNLSRTGWLKIADVLGGKTIQLEQQHANGYSAFQDQPDLTRIHIEGGNQNYVMLPPSMLSPEAIQQRLALLDTLAGRNNSQQAQEALQRARKLLLNQGAN